jgi:hypothetical protein
MLSSPKHFFGVKMLSFLFAFLAIISMLQSITIFSLCRELNGVLDTLAGHTSSIGRLNSRVMGSEAPVNSGKIKLPGSYFE